MWIIELQNVNKCFGKLQAVVDLNMRVKESTIHSIIGPNGAGKSTVFNLITGFLPVTLGSIFFNGEEMRGFKPYEIAQKGISRCFQQTFLFISSTAFENVIMGFHMSCNTSPIHEFFHTTRARKVENAVKKEALEILDYMGLMNVKDELAGNLPYGLQRALGVSIALACKPKLLLLDEPVTGMNPKETIDMVDRIRRIKESGTTVVLVEHNMRVVMDISDTITVLNYGIKIAEGLPQDIRMNKEVIEAYIGQDETDAT
jgi:branched-chain amino acid transport system ATP-binding protein